MNIKSIGQNATKVVKGAKKLAVQTVRDISQDKVVMQNLKNAKPVITSCVTAGTLFAFLPNNKKTQQPRKLEQKSGSLASLAVFAGTFSSFFKENKIEIKASKFGAIDTEALNKSLKTSKLNIVAFGLVVLGTKIATNITTKLLDKGLNLVKSKNQENK